MPTRTFRGTLDNDWGLAGNWLEGAIPTASDDVIFDSNSPNCTINASNRVALSLNCTNYTNILTFSFGLTVGGSITLGSQMQINGTAILSQSAAGSLTSNGFVLPIPFSIVTSTATRTFVDDWVFNSNLTLSVGATLSGGRQLSVNGNLIVNAIIPGAYTILLSGTGTWSGSGTLRGNLTINTNGTITISGIVRFDTGTLTHISGNVITTGTTLNIGANTSLNTPNMIWSNIAITVATVILTLLNDLVIQGSLVNTTSTSTSRSSIRSFSNGVMTKINLRPNAIQDIAYTDITDIDASLGQNLKTYKSTITNCINVFPLVPKKTLAFTFVR
jgi:hypothetical protein